MRLALAQINAVVGDLDGNVERVIDGRRGGARRRRRPRRLPGARPHRLSAGGPAAPAGIRQGGGRGARGGRAIAARTGSRPSSAARSSSATSHNARRGLRGRRASQAGYFKHFLPNYGVFDEHRYFAEGRELVLLGFGDVLVGPTICEDIWQPGPPATDLALAGAQLLVNLSASPFHVGKAEDREEMLVTRARDNAAYLAFCNLVGGQDELVFDGHSVVLDDEGEVIARAPGFEEALLVVDVDPLEAIGRRLKDVRRRELERTRDERPPASRSSTSRLRGRSRARRRAGRRSPRSRRSSSRCGSRSASACATTSHKNGFGDVVLGISGGIDSAVTAAICADALGAERVHTVSMPSRFSSAETRDDAREVSENLGVDFREIPIESVVGAFQRGPRAASSGLAAENLQARVRGTLLMALSNSEGWLVVHDREQVGDGGRLRDALRRHGRRLRAAQGRASRPTSSGSRAT